MVPEAAYPGLVVTGSYGKAARFKTDALRASGEFFDPPAQKAKGRPEVALVFFAQ